MLSFLQKAVYPFSRNSIFWIITAFITATLPWANHIAKWGVIILAAFYILDKRLLTKIGGLAKQPIAILLIAFFGLNVIGYFFAADQDVAAETIVRRLSFLIFPLVYSTEEKFSKEQWKGLATLYVLSTFCAMLFIEVYGVYRYFTYEPIGNIHVLIYELLAQPLLHPGLLSIYLFLGLIWSSQQLIFQKPYTFLPNTFLIAHAVFTIIVLGQLTSKSIFIVLFLYTIWMLYQIVKGNLSPAIKRWATIGTLAIIPIFILMVRLLLWERFASIADDLGHLGKDVAFTNSVGSRLTAFKEGIQLILQKPIFGFGTGQGNAALLQQLKTEGYTNLVQNEMHTHNQFLKIAIEFGLIGLGIILTAFGALLLQFKKNSIAGWVLILCIINCCTDDVLDIENGILFFLFFVSFMFFGGEEGEQKPVHGNNQKFLIHKPQ